MTSALPNLLISPNSNILEQRQQNFDARPFPLIQSIKAVVNYETKKKKMKKEK